MSERADRTEVAILRVLEAAGEPLGAALIARGLGEQGIELTERAVRYHLKALDSLGLTENLGRKGRRITDLGRRELQDALVGDKVGLAISRVNALAYQTSFDPVTRRGELIINVSLLPLRSLKRALKAMAPVFRAGLCTSDLVAYARAGEPIGGREVPPGSVALGTVCSVTINGVLLKRGVPVESRFGGLLEVEGRAPVRFTEIINYDGCSLDPLEIFIKGKMTQTAEAAERRRGKVGASFREVPAVCLGAVRQAVSQMAAASIHGITAIGEPGRPLLEIPIRQGQLGLVVFAGLNPLAAAEEAGIPTTNSAMAAPFSYRSLVSFWDL